MKKIFLLLALVILSFGVNAYAVSFNAIQSIIPHTKISKVLNTPITGLYGALLPNGQIVYVYPLKKLLVFGQIWTNTGKNLTNISVSNIQESKVLQIEKYVNLNKAIKIGHGPLKVIEFMNIDCPFCRAFEKLTSESKTLRSAMTRYVFLFPQPSIHPHSTEMELYYFTKMQHLTNKARVALLNKIMVKQVYATKAGNVPPKFKQSGFAMKELDYTTHLAQKFQIFGVPYFIIKNHAVLGLNIGKIYKLLGIKTVNVKKIQSNLYKNFK